MNFDNYDFKKNLLLDRLGKIECLSIKYQLNDVSEKIDLAIKDILDEHFSVVVIGDFSRGKSTFINSLLEKNVLPSSKQPTTAVLNKIVYSKKPYYIIRYKNGTSKTISEDEFLEIKAQSELDDNLISKLKGLTQSKIDDLKKSIIEFNSINYVEIGYPLAFCRNNVEVIDTPGTNDINVARSEITYRYLKHAEAAILILSAEQPLTKSEMDFLKERVLGNQIDNIFVVINYKDILDGDRQQEARVKQYVIDNISSVGANIQKVFMVSSKQALLYYREKSGDKLSNKMRLLLPNSLEETGIPEVKEALSSFLDVEKGNVKIRKYCNVALSQLDTLQSVIMSRHEHLGHSSTELREQLAIEKPKYYKVRNETKLILERLSTRLQLHCVELKQKADVVANRIIEAAVAAADNYHNGMSAEKLQYEINKVVLPIHNNFITELENFKKEVIDEETNKAVEELQKIWDDIFSKNNINTENVAFDSELDVQIKYSKNYLSYKKPSIFYIGYNVFFRDFNGLSLLLLPLEWGLRWLIGSIFDSVFSHTSKVKEEVREQYRNGLANFSDEVVNKYCELTQKICNYLQDEVDCRTDIMEMQLIDIIKKIEGKDYEAKIERELLMKELNETRQIWKDLKGL